MVEVTAGRPVDIAAQVARHPPGRWSARVTLAPSPAGGRHPPGRPPGRRAGFEQAVTRTYSLVDATQLPVVREVRDRYVNPRQPLASTAVKVRRLARDDLLIEVEAVAVMASVQP